MGDVVDSVVVVEPAAALVWKGITNITTAVKYRYTTIARQHRIVNIIIHSLSFVFSFRDLNLKYFLKITTNVQPDFDVGGVWSESCILGCPTSSSIIVTRGSKKAKVQYSIIVI